MKNALKILGPSLLYAGAAIGVSHIVQSTRAGAMYNFDLLIVLIIANILKYPFFEYGPRYASATGNNLIDGYSKIGKWAVILFTFVTVGSMFTIQAAVTVVSVALIAYVFKITISITALSIILLLIAVAILIFGKYSLLDKIMKFIIVILAISTITAVFAALGIHKVVTPESLTRFSFGKATDILFLIAFVGWMPAPIDVSVWSSIWNLNKVKELGYAPSVVDTVNEFKIGYIGTAILAACFLTMGALVMYGTGEEFSASGVKFAKQLISMYTNSLGNWAYWIVSIAAVTTMISTTITVLDAYPKVLNPIFQHLFPKKWKSIKNKELLTWLWFAILLTGTILIIAFATKSMGALVNVATTLSFLTAPILAWLNLKVVTSKHMPKDAVPGMALQVLSWIGIVFFIAFSLVFFYWKFF